jgi:pyridinium-3,5-biscarboxylic acid mononucleotide sulfurtransferase
MLFAYDEVSLFLKVIAMVATATLTLPPELAQKRDHLLAILRGLGRVAVAFSGGIDSTVVAFAAKRALADAAVAVTADSPSVPRAEVEEARRLADLIGIRHVVVTTAEFADPNYVRNDGSRCYFCKSELYSRIETQLAELGADVICSGANLDDQGDYRPGLKAAAEHRVRHPLQEAGFTKADVRALALHWELPTWDKPASPCLSSRLAPGVEVTRERTARVEAAEEYLHALGYRECRVRLHEGELARVEVPADGLQRLLEPKVHAELVRRLKELGFRYVTLDLEGFRSGNLNSLVSLEFKRLYTPTATP